MLQSLKNIRDAIRKNSRYNIFLSLVAINLAAVFVNVVYFRFNLVDYSLKLTAIYTPLNLIIFVPIAFFLYLRRETSITRAIRALKTKQPIDENTLALAKFKLMRRPRFVANMVFTIWFISGLYQAPLFYFMGYLSLTGAIHIFLGVSIVANPIVSLLCYLFVEIASRNDMRVLEIDINEQNIVFPVLRKIVFSVSFFSILLILFVVTFFYGILNEISPSFGLEGYSRYAIRIELIAAIAIGYLLVMTYMVAISITGPLKEVMAAMKRVSEGNLETLADITSTDEVAVLTKGFNEMMRGLSERERIKQLFGRYVSTEIRDAILSGNMELGGEELEATILFADIRNFTSLSEKYTASQVVEMLNAYFTEMVKAITHHGGVVDKFIGDAVMAIFGAPVRQPDHALRAINAAREMVERLHAHNFLQDAKEEPRFEIGIGINTGMVILGNIGSEDRKEYTAIGDAVNTASRIEGLTRQHAKTILFSESTRDKAGFGEFVAESWVKGKVEKLSIYTL